jgi:PleD family two-component response regulator
MAAGGENFLTKPIDPDHLARAVFRRAERARRSSALQNTDSLTGLENFRAVEESLEQLMGRALREGSPLSLGMIDLDHFKAINDNYGHATGDRVLQAMGRLLRQRFRDPDVAGRHGGGGIPCGNAWLLGDGGIGIAAGRTGYLSSH